MKQSLRSMMTGLGFVETGADTYEAINQGNRVAVRWVEPTYSPSRRGGATIVKTHVETCFARPSAVPFLVHGRARLVLGATLEMNDPAFDERFVIRAEPAATPVFGDEVRRAIGTYEGWAPSLDLDERRVLALFEGLEPSMQRVRDSVFSQATLIDVMQRRIDALGLHR